MSDDLAQHSNFEWRVIIEMLQQTKDYVDASQEYSDSLPGELKWDTIRRSLRAYSFFNSPWLFDDPRDFEFMYSERYEGDHLRRPADALTDGAQEATATS